MAAYQVEEADAFKEHNSDSSSHRQTAMQNIIVRIPTEDGYKTITLSSAILADNETAECVTESIVRTFKEGRDLFDFWWAVVNREYKK